VVKSSRESYYQVLLCRGELELLRELGTPCRIDILLSLVLPAAGRNWPTLVPHARDIHVAATLDTILALWRDFSDIVIEGLWEVRIKGEGFTR